MAKVYVLYNPHAGGGTGAESARELEKMENCLIVLSLGV